jgi:hypothetical protein
MLTSIVVMGNKKDMIWVLEIFANTDKSAILKVYEFATIRHVAYVLNLKPSTISNYYHSLIRIREIFFSSKTITSVHYSNNIY